MKALLCICPVPSMWSLVVSICFAGRILQAQPADVPKQNLWITDGIVSAMAATNGMVFLGGSFNYVGPYTGGGVPLDVMTGQAGAAFPVVNGEVHAVAVDGAGGWYIGGSFEEVGQFMRKNLAHIRNDGSVDPDWNPEAEGTEAPEVNALLLSGNTLYAGGTFTSLGGNSRNNIGALDAATGHLASWDPNSSSSIFTLSASANIIYAGGSFTNMGGQLRNRIAALDKFTGQPLSWNANANSNVFAIIVSGSNMYVGGKFTQIGGHPRNALAALNTATGEVSTNWNANVQSFGDSQGIRALAIAGTNLYVGGNFFSIGGLGGQVRNGLAALDIETGKATSWNSAGRGFDFLSPQVTALAISGNTIYVGGRFARLSGQQRNNIAALNTNGTTNQSTSWNPNASSDVLAIAISGNTLYAGGKFSSIGGQSRTNLAALDSLTGRATSWNANANSNVLALAVSGNRLYAGGNFSRVAGQSRSRIAALDLATGTALTNWNPNATGPVEALLVSGTNLYAGGQFKSIGGQPRALIAALDIESGLVTDWNPNGMGGTAAEVRVLALGSNTVYAGGSFSMIGGQLRNNLAALDVASGLATTWNPSVIGTVDALAVAGNTVYVGGSFIKIGVQSRNNIAALNGASGKPIPSWNPSADGTVSAILIHGTLLYAGGNFLNLGGAPRGGIALLDLATAQVQPWQPVLSGGEDSSVLSLALAGTALYVGGSFDRVDGLGLPSIASFELQSNSGELNFVPGSAQRLADGTFQFRINAGAARTLIIQGSADLGEWATLKTYSLSNPSSQIDFRDEPAASLNHRFYRAISEP